MKDKEHEVSTIQIQDTINQCVNHYGLEGTEDIIKRTLSGSHLSIMRNKFLEIYYNKIRN